MGIWLRFGGRATHDRWTNYDHWPCAYSLCEAHVLRDGIYVQEQQQQEWRQRVAGEVHPPFSAEKARKQWGRPKQSAAKDLLDELLRRAEQALAFLDDLSSPYLSDHAERDLRLVTAHQKFACAFALQPEQPLSNPLAVICPPWASRDMPCWEQ